MKLLFASVAVAAIAIAAPAKADPMTMTATGFIGGNDTFTIVLTYDLSQPNILYTNPPVDYRGGPGVFISGVPSPFLSASMTIDSQVYQFNPSYFGELYNNVVG
jgi:hypothetical protein